MCVSNVLMSLCSFSAFCKSSLNHLQMPYIRATHKFDFLCLFLAIWCDILTLICACGALARTLSICLDAMTGGMARIYLLGRNSIDNEPWPDVLGFSVVFMVSGMFMLGLEVCNRQRRVFLCDSPFKLHFLQNSQIFWYLMMISAVGISMITVSVAWIRGTFDAWQSDNLLPKGYSGVSHLAFHSVVEKWKPID